MRSSLLYILLSAALYRLLMHDPFAGTADKWLMYGVVFGLPALVCSELEEQRSFRVGIATAIAELPASRAYYPGSEEDDAY